VRLAGEPVSKDYRVERSLYARAVDSVRRHEDLHSFLLELL